MEVSDAQCRTRVASLILPRHPEAPSESDFISWCRKEKEQSRPLAIDLFSGAGGLGLGIEAAGWTVAAAVDHDRAALLTHEANFRGQALNVDMHDPSQVASLIAKLKPLDIDLVAGGPPCQPFSRAGRAKIRSLVDAGTRDNVDPRKDLWKSFLDVVVAIRPRAVIMENVPDMAIGDDLSVIRKIAAILEQSDYCVDYRLLDAWHYGVPQHRKRFILQARRDGQVPKWPTSNQTITTVRDAISDLPRLYETTGSREMPLRSRAHSTLALALRDETSNVIYDHFTRSVRSDDREAFTLMNSTTLYSDLPERLRRYRSDTFVDKYKRLDWDGLSRTITAHIAKDGYWYIHPEEHRTISVREAARIQTFPDRFRFAGSRSDAFRQIGNAVPPKLGYIVANSIRSIQNGEAEESHLPNVRKCLVEWATRNREKHWYLHPGPTMTDAGAAIASLLDVHRLAASKAHELMDPLQSEAELSLESLSHIDARALTAKRRASIRQIRSILRHNEENEWVFEFKSLLNESQLKNFSMLCGQDTLIVNEHVRKNITFLMDLPAIQTGLRTGIKVALAQIVALDADSALRMSAIHKISLDELRTELANSEMTRSATIQRKDGSQ